MNKGVASFGARGKTTTTPPAAEPAPAKPPPEKPKAGRSAAKRADLAVTTIRLDADDLERLRIESIKAKTSVQAIVEEGINLWCAQHGIKPIRATCRRD